MFRYLLILIISLSSLLTSPAWARAWIIDTDVGLDDIIAIFYVLNQANMPVKAISIEADGNAHCQPAYASIQGVLRLAQQESIPVACGRHAPLRGHHHFPTEILESQDQLSLAFPSHPSILVPALSAKTLLLKTLRSSPQALNILAIGPLTTLAEVIQEHPELKSKIHGIYIMGGAVRVPGNIRSVDFKSHNETAEWNIYIDPAAANILFHSGLSLTLVPLDVTQQALIDESFYQDLQKQQASPGAKLILSLFNQNLDQLRKKEWYFWDPMAAVIADHESIGHFETLKLSVRQTPESQSGATVIDNKQGAKVRVCTGIDLMKFKHLLLTGLSTKS